MQEYFDILNNWFIEHSVSVDIHIQYMDIMKEIKHNIEYIQNVDGDYCEITLKGDLFIELEEDRLIGDFMSDILFLKNCLYFLKDECLLKIISVVIGERLINFFKDEELEMIELISKFSDQTKQDLLNVLTNMKELGAEIFYDDNVKIIICNFIDDTLEINADFQLLHLEDFLVIEIKRMQKIYEILSNHLMMDIFLKEIKDVTQN